MAFGGGSFTTQNKKLPGTYINFVSASRASAIIGDRGVAAIPMVMDWGASGVIEISNDDFRKKSLSILGYEYAHDKLKGLRDLFMNTKTVYLYRLNDKGVKATNEFADAKYPGVRGNDIKIVITKNVDNQSKYDVSTLIDLKEVDKQTVTTANELVANEFVVFKSTATLKETAAKPLASGTNGSEVSTAEYQSFLNAIESYSFNALCCPTKDTQITKLFVEFTKRMRDELGVKFQTVIYKEEKINYEGVVSVKNKALNADEFSLVYWVTGVIAGCPINETNTNRIYDGSFEVEVNYTQLALAESLEKGMFTLHRVGNDIRVLEDINTLTEVTDKKNSDFFNNQTIRVIDQIANDIAVLFNTKYIGKIPNNASGRISLWNDVVTYYKNLESLQAIENFNSEDVEIEQGATKKSVVMIGKINIVGSMSQLYMTTTIA